MRLEIYVASDCLGCTFAHEIADQARHISGIDVAVIDLDNATHALPESVVAVPTYLLDGQVVSLGNPPRERFLATLRQRANSQQVSNQQAASQQMSKGHI